MEIRNNLELVMVEYENNGNKAIMTFLDKEREEIRTVNFNRQVFDENAKKWVNSDEKAEKVDSWCNDFFGTSFDNLESCVGVLKDVYVYDNFNSLFEVATVSKFTKDMEGEIFQTAIDEIIVDNVAIRIRYKINDEVYESKMTFAKYVEALKQWIIDPQKKQKVFEKFEDRYLVPVEEKDSLVGHPIMVECKIAMGKFPYGEVKKFPRKK